MSIARRLRQSGEIVARLFPAWLSTAQGGEMVALWAEMDRLANEGTAQWTGTPSAVDAVREGRREM